MSIRAPKLRTDFTKGDAFSRSSASRSGGLRWSKDYDAFKHSLDGLALATVEQVAEKMKSTGSAIIRDARAKTYAEKKWDDHEDLHPSELYPSARTAAQGMFVYLVQRKSFIELALTHSPNTIYLGGNDQFDYGVQLEIGFGGKYAVIQPTLAAHSRDVMEACTNAMVKSQQEIKRQNAGGRGSIHSGWTKGAND